MALTPDWTVEGLGRGVFLFRWNVGFYVSPFVVGANGVTAFDPISDVAAIEYRRAIASVTELPITRLIYSHDHRDHICGGRSLVGDAECEIAAHVATHRRVERRNDGLSTTANISCACSMPRARCTKRLEGRRRVTEKMAWR